MSALPQGSAPSCIWNSHVMATESPEEEYQQLSRCLVKPSQIMFVCRALTGTQATSCSRRNFSDKKILGEHSTAVNRYSCHSSRFVHPGLAQGATLFNLIMKGTRYVTHSQSESSDHQLFVCNYQSWEVPDWDARSARAQSMTLGVVTMVTSIKNGVPYVCISCHT